jgi:hypothetical protein
MKKLIAILLALVSVLFVVSACANGKDKKPGPGTIDDGREWVDSVPDMDMGGAVINFYVSESDPPELALSARSIAVEEDDGDIVNTEIYNRNKRLEARFNCEIVLVEANASGIQAAVTPTLMSGTPDYDILGGRQHDDIDLCLEGYLINFNDLADFDADYIDIDQPWWGKDYIEKMSYKDKMYWLTGILSLRYISGARCFFVNERLYQRYLQESYGSLYSIVKSKEWTLDLMSSMAALCYSDENGNDVGDKGDIFGLNIGLGDDFTDALAYAYGVRYSSVAADGSISFDLNTANNLYFEYMNKASGIYMSKYSFHMTSGGPDFSAGEVLFQGARLQYAQNYREMEDDFYVVPLPIRAKGMDYTTTLHDGNLLFGIAHCSEQIPFAAAVLEAMAAEAYDKVMPAYYELALKYKYTRDEEAADVIDIIRDSTTTDFGYIWGRSIDCLYFTRRSFTGGAYSQMAKLQEAWVLNFQKLIESFEKVGETT